MNNLTTAIRRFHNDEGGAALMMVILITLLLVTASAAMLSAVGASSRNTADALSEAKAYWAAESGLQATINALRHQDVDYGAAASNPSMSNWLTYDSADPTDDPTRVEISTEESYQISVSDPDNTGGSTTFNSTGSFQKSSVTPYVTTYVWPLQTPTPDPTPSPLPEPTPPVDYTTITWIDPAGDTTIDHANPPRQLETRHFPCGILWNKRRDN